MSVSSSPIRVGLIGVGNWALRGHLPILLDMLFAMVGRPLSLS